MKRVIIDTDPGVDDVAALLLALNSPELEVVACTTIYGNASVETCTANLVRVLAAAGRHDIPVYKGAGKPLLRPATAGWASHIHGADGLGGLTSNSPSMGGQESGMASTGGKTPQVADLHAALAIVEAALAYPGDVSILALGRLTNVALALALNPDVAAAVREIVVMGGAVTVPGNVSQVATANLHEDPEAAAMVYDSGASIIQVGLDVCNRVTVSPSQLQRLSESSSPATQLLAQATGGLRDAYIRTGRIGPDEGVRYNDLPAVAYAVNPDLFSTRPALVTIETQSELTRGQTVADRDSDHSNTQVCLDVDAEALTALFTDRLSGPG